MVVVRDAARPVVGLLAATHRARAALSRRATRAGGAGTMSAMPRRPALRRTLAAVVAIAVAAPACTRPDGGAPADSTRFARAVRALRRATVGDRWLEPVRDARSPATARVAMVPARARRGAIVGVGGGAPLDLRSGGTPGGDAPGADPLAHPDWPARVIRFTTVAGAPDTIWTGDTLVVAPPPVPDGTPATIAADLRWQSLAPDVATVSAAGVVTAHRAGSADVVAWRRVGETVTPVTVLPAVRGRVASADDAPLGARVVLHGDGWTDSARTAPDGTFAFRLAAPVDGPLSLRVEPDDAGHAPALLAGAPPERLADVDVVLLPARWRVTSGSYAGTVVPIRPTIAHAAARDALRLWHVARPGREGRPDDGRAVGWAPERLPLPLAFDHRGAGATIAPADSVAFWAIAHQLERDWGAPLFRPATLPAGDDGFGGLVATIDPRIGSEGLTTTGWNGDGDLYDAVVSVRSRALLAHPAVVTHELLHALGIGHAPYALASVMHPVGDGGDAGRASAADVAYGQLLYAVRARGRRGRVTLGVAEAAAAERRP